MKYVLLVLALFSFVGCEQMAQDLRMNARHGKPGDVGYIEPKFVKATIIVVQKDYITEKTASGTLTTRPHTIVEAFDGKRYGIVGVVGEVGEEFQLDISLRDPL